MKGHQIRGQAISLGRRELRRPPRHAGALLLAVFLLPACSVFAPIVRAPVQISDDELERVTTRDEAVQRFGPPVEIRESDVGPVLVYRRATTFDVNPNRFYGPDYDEQFRQYELLLLYLDEDGKIVRREVQRE